MAASPLPPAQQKASATHTLVEHNTMLSIYSDPWSYRRTSIICTIGPKTKSPEKLGELFEAGMNVVRMNFSHGSYEYHGEVIANTRAMCEAKKKDGVVPPVAIALDTKGPEIRTGMTTDGGDVQLEKGQKLIVTTDPAWKDKVDSTTMYLDYVNLPKMVNVGSLIFIDDGLISVEVKEIAADFVSVTCEVVNSGLLGSKKGVNLPEVDVDLPALSEKDKADIRFGVEQNVDMVFASFIRKKSDIQEVRDCLGPDGAHIKIIAKIENHEGVRNFDEILEVTDGVMVARGDLGIEIPAEKVFVAQKMMISKCNLVGKPIICATQMLESMTTNPRPTRAEVSDVSNAVIDGADCVMLSGETAKGAYPVQAVEMMHKICREAECATYLEGLYAGVRNYVLQQIPMSADATTAFAAANAANANSAMALVVLSHSGGSARQLSQYRPKCPILVLTRNERCARIVHLYRGCYPVLYTKPRNEEESWDADVQARFDYAIAHFKATGHIKGSGLVVGVQGMSAGPGSTNMLKILPC